MSNPESSLWDVQLNAVGVLLRREIEARILVPILSALGEALGQEQVLEVVRRVIIEIAQNQGAELASSQGRSDLPAFAETLEAWKRNDALRMDVLEINEAVFSFNVTRCRYAEMYQELGVPELGFFLSCSRDFSLVEGFNPQIRLERTQTIMQGAPICDFRYRCSK